MSEEFNLTDLEISNIIQSVSIEISPDESYVELELETYVNGQVYFVGIDADVYTNMSLDTEECWDWPSESTIELDCLDINDIVIMSGDDEFILSGNSLEQAKTHFKNTLIYI